MTAPRPYTVAVADDVLADLRAAVWDRL